MREFCTHRSREDTSSSHVSLPYAEGSDVEHIMLRQHAADGTRSDSETNKWNGKRQTPKTADAIKIIKIKEVQLMLTEKMNWSYDSCMGTANTEPTALNIAVAECFVFLSFRLACIFQVPVVRMVASFEIINISHARLASLDNADLQSSYTSHSYFRVFFSMVRRPPGIELVHMRERSMCAFRRRRQTQESILDKKRLLLFSFKNEIGGTIELRKIFMGDFPKERKKKKKGNNGICYGLRGEQISVTLLTAHFMLRWLLFSFEQTIEWMPANW